MSDVTENGGGATGETQNRPLFRDINAEDYDPEITELESLCVNCEEQGVTKLFLTRIPFFREVIVSSFSCDHCGYRNAELQPSGRIQDRGVCYKLMVKTGEDLNRQVVQTASATVKIPELSFEAPPGKSCLTTVEGIIDRVVSGLDQDQVLRRIQHPKVAAQIDDFIEKLKSLKEMKEPFELVVDDPSGNSFVENPHAPRSDPDLVVGHYSRTLAQEKLLGLVDDTDEHLPSEVESGAGGGGEVVGQDDGEGLNTQNEVLSFQVNCSNCGSPCETHMKVVNIPHFKEVVIMATSCDRCGVRDNEVKSGGGVEEKGQRMELQINTREDMARDVLKSETASIEIPELDFGMEMGTLGGKFSTIEGLLEDIKTQLKGGNPFVMGDSSTSQQTKQLQEFCDKMDNIIQNKVKGYHFILNDPAGNSYIQSLCHPDPDPQLKVSSYTRTWQQNEDLGLNDMKTENYESA